MLLSALLLLFGGAQAYHFEFDGHFAAISVEDVKEGPTNRGHFLTAEEKLKERLSAVLSGHLDEFYVHSFSIHGEDIHPSAIFTAFLSSSLSRTEIVKLVADAHDVDFFRLKELESLPPAPEISSNLERVSECFNGGFLLPNMSCACPPFFLGDSCEEVSCLNGGIVSNGRCACPPGRYALNCEQRGCLPSTLSDEGITKKPSFILVVSIKSTMAYVLNELANNLETVLDDFFASARFTEYIVVSYVHTKGALMMSSATFATIPDMIQYLNTLIFTVQGREKQPTQRAVLEAQSFDPFMQAGSTVFVFTDSLDEDAGPVNYTLASQSIESQLILQTLAWNNRIVYFFSETGTVDRSQAGDGYDTFERVAKATLGDIYTYPIMETATVLTTIVYYGGQTVAARYGIGSTISTTHVSIPETSGTAAINILITVPAGKLPTVTSGNRLPLSKVVNGTRFAIYQSLGNSQMVIVHPDAEKFNIRAMTETGDSVFLTAAYDSNVDAGTVYLSANYDNMMSFYATGITPEQVRIEWITLDTAAVVSSPMEGVSRREECTYNKQFGPFPKCPLLGSIAQSVRLTDDEGQSTTILVPGYCLEMERRFLSQFICQNGGSRQGVRTCRCTEDWMGQDCSTPKCYNNGQPNKFPGNGFGACNCPTGYSGDHCEILACTTPPTDPLPSTNTTIALVMQNTLSQAQIGASIDAGLSTLLKQMQGKDTYSEYILTTFHFQKDGGTTENSMIVNKFGLPSIFESAVNSVSYRPTPINSQASLMALEATILATTGGTTALFLFVDEGPIETAQEADVIRMAVERQIQLNIIITAPYEMMSMCMSKGQQNFYQQVAQKTGGIFLNLCQELRESYAENIIHSLFVSYADSHHRTETINEQVFATEPPTKEIFFTVDQPNNDVFLIVNCPQEEGFTVTITNLEFNVPQAVKPVKVMPYLGVYKVPTTQLNRAGYDAQVHAPNNACNLKIVIKSNHAVYVRYSPDPSMDAQQSNTTFGIPMFAVLHVQNPDLDRTSYPTLNALNDKNTVGWTDHPYVRTNSCVFEYFTQYPFICDRPSDSFTLQLISSTKDGFSYSRSLRSFCYLGAQECLNGGYRLSNGLCKCPSDYGGLYCQSPKCKNAAFLDTDTFTCRCLYKWTGRLCDIPVCNDWNFLESVDPRNHNPKQITFVLNSLADSLLVNVQLSSQIQAIVSATEFQDTPVMYTLIMFDQFSSQRIISTSNAGQFVQAFQSYVTKVQQIPGSGSRSIDALVDAWKMNIQSPGVVYLFTSTQAMTPFAMTAFDDFLQQKIDTQVNVFYTPKYQGNYPALPTDTNSNALFQAVKQSGGRIVALTQNSVSQIAPMIISSTQVVEFVSDESLEDCTGSCGFSFSLENQYKTVEITVLGIDVSGRGNVEVLAGRKTKLPIDSTSIVFSDTQILVLRYKSTKAQAGTWSVLVKTALGGAEIQTRVISDIHVFPGFTIDQNDDFVHQVPFTGLGLNRSTFMTFRVVDSSDHLSNSALLESIVVSRANFYKPTTAQVVQDLLVYPRDTDTCAYQFVSREWIVDTHPQQQFTVFGTLGNTIDPPFQRTFFYQFPVLSQRQATCIHGQHDSFGQCICSDRTKWTGDYCQTPICQHGGTVSYGICICQNGYFGDFCELNVTV